MSLPASQEKDEERGRELPNTMVTVLGLGEPIFSLTLYYDNLLIMSNSYF